MIFCRQVPVDPLQNSDWELPMANSVFGSEIVSHLLSVLSALPHQISCVGGWSVGHQCYPCCRLWSVQLTSSPQSFALQLSRERSSMRDFLQCETVWLAPFCSSRLACKRCVRQSGWTPEPPRACWYSVRGSLSVYWLTWYSQDCAQRSHQAPTLWSMLHIWPWDQS